MNSSLQPTSIRKNFLERVQCQSKALRHLQKEHFHQQRFHRKEIRITDVLPYQIMNVLSLPNYFLQPKYNNYFFSLFTFTAGRILVPFRSLKRIKTNKWMIQLEWKQTIKHGRQQHIWINMWSVAKVTYDMLPNNFHVMLCHLLGV